MKTKELIKEIQKLPVRKRIYVIERSMNLMGKQEDEDQMNRTMTKILTHTRMIIIRGTGKKTKSEFWRVPSDH